MDNIIDFGEARNEKIMDELVSIFNKRPDLLNLDSNKFSFKMMKNSKVQNYYKV